MESSDKNLQLNDGDETDLGNDEIKQDSSEDKNQEDSENPMSNSEDQDDDSENADEDALTTVKGTFNAYFRFCTFSVTSLGSLSISTKLKPLDYPNFAQEFNPV